MSGEYFWAAGNAITRQEQDEVTIAAVEPSNTQSRLRSTVALVAFLIFIAFDVSKVTPEARSARSHSR